MSETVRYVDVAPAVPLSPRAKSLYTYRLPENWGQDGQALLFRAVEMSFGGRRVKGVIMVVRTEAPPFPTQIIKRLSAVQLTARQVQFAQWLARTMQGGLGFTLRLFLPPRL